MSRTKCLFDQKAVLVLYIVAVTMLQPTKFANFSELNQKMAYFWPLLSEFGKSSHFLAQNPDFPNSDPKSQNRAFGQNLVTQICGF